VRSLKLVLTGPARNDLMDIFNYIAVENEEAAEMVVSRLFDAFDLLSRFPSIGVRSKSRRRRVFYRMKYAIYFEPNLAKDELVVLRVMHMARDRSNV
jgi:toxin ParE1/3/4